MDYLKPVTCHENKFVIVYNHAFLGDNVSQWFNCWKNKLLPTVHTYTHLDPLYLLYLHNNYQVLCVEQCYLNKFKCKSTPR